MKINKTLCNVVTIYILVSLVPIRFERAASKNTTQQESPVRLLTSEQDCVIFELVTPEYILEDQMTEDGLYQVLWVDGFGMMDTLGGPQLPTSSVMLGLPENGRVKISFSSDEIGKIPIARDISPVPLSIPEGDLSSESQTLHRLNQEIYQQNRLFPDSPVKVEEYGWLRDQYFVRIGLYPFQYNPVDKVVLHSQRLIVQVDILNDTSSNIDNHGYTNSINSNSPYEAIFQNYILNYNTSRVWRTYPEVDANHQTLATGERLRIVLNEDGLYRINYTDLINSGFTGTNPQTFRMTNQGRNVAIKVVGEEDGTLDEDDYILFYGEAYRGDTMAAWYSDENRNWITYPQQLPDGTTTLWHPSFTADMMEKYSNENVYWLQSVTDSTPMRMQLIDGSPGEATVPAYYHTTTHEETQWTHWEYHFTNEDTWLWRYLDSASAQVLTIDLSSIYIEPFTATIRAEYVAFSYSIYSSPDHHTVVHLNSRIDPINESYWDGRSRYRFETGVPSSDLLDGTNSLIFTVIEDDAVRSQMYIDWFEIDYLRRFVAIDDGLSFPGENTGTWRYQMEGFSQPGIQVYDITDPLQPKFVSNVNTYLDGTYHAEFQYTHDAGAHFYAVGENEIRTPVDITLYTPPDLKSSSNGADYLIISHADFIATAQALADYRSSQGLRVQIVDVQDLYNEFNEGIRHPIAIKNFLEYTFAYWTPPVPLYVVIVGDGHWDILDTGYTTAEVYMPPNLSWVDPLQGEVDSSNLLATIAGDDPLADVLIGRIPVNTAQELQNVIDKIISFEQTSDQDWQRNNTFIADNTPDSVGDFPGMADLIIEQYIEPGFTPIRIYEDDFGCPDPYDPSKCLAVTQEISNTIDVTGTLFMTYIGHAATQNWSHERIFTISNIASLTNADRLPVVLSMDCLDGYWIHPTLQPSMAEVFLRSGNYGAVATFSPTGLGVGLGHYMLMQGFFGSVYRDGLWEMGAATLGAKIALYNAGYYRDMLHTFTTFGDPALRFPNPYGLSVSPTLLEKQSIIGTQLTYNIQVTNAGSLSDTFSLTVEDNIWPTTLSTNLLTLNPGESVAVVVKVDLPQNITNISSDTSIIQVLSDGNASERQSVTIISTALFGVRLPIIRK